MVFIEELEKGQNIVKEVRTIKQNFLGKELYEKVETRGLPGTVYIIRKGAKTNLRRFLFGLPLLFKCLSGGAKITEYANEIKIEPYNE